MEVQSPDGPMRMWFTGEYREVTENSRLVYTESLCDENGDVLSPSAMGIPVGVPPRPRSGSKLDDVDGRTRMVMTDVRIPQHSPGAAGWAMALDKLATHAAAHSDR